MWGGGGGPCHAFPESQIHAARVLNDDIFLLFVVVVLCVQDNVVPLTRRHRHTCLPCCVETGADVTLHNFFLISLSPPPSHTPPPSPFSHVKSWVCIPPRVLYIYMTSDPEQ